ncbi:uncharacterized protein LOC125232249 [Leguminivora glycinivorella]|uniref:uncharacterized protein LOC125232249 n=1 Tax=Leguminivora glycinivorella TaxID=1035111 RepID=UPI00200CA47F|nr:uncharacterized protein LOC125232249 [Leguminivora glycinivorella]
MNKFIAFAVCAICITIYQTNGLNLIDVPKEYISRLDLRHQLYRRYRVKPFKASRSLHQIQARRQGANMEEINKAKDNTLKEKIGFLIEQTINDAKKELLAVDEYKSQHNRTAEYRIGFLMYMVKRSRDVMNELFTVAVNHKDDWKALDQLKIFELIIHTNVDTSNLLRQLLEIAVQETPKKDQTEERLRRLRVALL